MKGSVSDEDKSLDRQMGERKEEAKERQAPSPPSTTVSVYQGPRLKTSRQPAIMRKRGRRKVGVLSRWRRNKRKGR